jgi:hypothetical protein
VKVVTHDKYSFYNPKHHPMFDQNDGRTIYFEGTYTHSFSGNPEQTPRYDYNQIMYRLDLSDARLNQPVAIYDRSNGAGTRFASASDARSNLASRGREPPNQAAPELASIEFSSRTTPADDPTPRRAEIAFFAPDRPADGLVAVRESTTLGGNPSLTVGPPEGTDDLPVVCYALPAEVENPPGATVLLYEFTSTDGTSRNYSTNSDSAPAGFHRAGIPIARVWRNPYRPD